MTDAARELGDLSQYDIRENYPAKGALRGWSDERDQIVNVLMGTYEKIAQGRGENYALRRACRGIIRDALERKFAQTGLTNAPLFLAALAQRAAPLYVTRDADSHVQFVQAIFTDASPTFWDHWRYRQQTEGNTHADFVGGTGTGKSSCAIYVANWGRRIEPARILEHVNFDLGQLPTKLTDKQRGDTVIQDEFPELTGEGARNTAALFNNIADQIRKAGVNLLRCSPALEAHATTQLQLEAIAVNRNEQWTAFLLHVAETPMGVVAIPWAPLELWEPYSAFKDANVERALSGAFKDKRWVAQKAMAMYENEDIIDWLTKAVRKPKKSDFDDAVANFNDEQMTTSQQERVVKLMYAWAAGFERFEDKFHDKWSVTPNDGLRRVAEEVAKKG